MSEPDFCAAFAPLLGPSVAADGLLDRLTATLERDQAMEEATAALRAAGVTTVLLSNSLGYGAYDGCDFDRLFDHVVISGDVGMRKPSSSIYRHALEAAGADAARAVFVDDFEHNIAAARALGLAAILHRDAAETIPRLEAAFGGEQRAA
jgi:putative hydrolase of the HAD superfamily